MLTSIEIALICSFVAVFSCVEVLSARTYLRDFPWHELVSKLDCFGGVSDLVKRCVMLICWVNFSLALALLFAVIAKFFVALLLHNLAIITQYWASPVVAALPTLLSVAGYIAFCECMRAHAKRQQRGGGGDGSSEAYRTQRFICGESSSPGGGRARGNSLLAALTFLPRACYSLYCYFYLDAGKLLQGASNALVQQYGAETVVRFCESQRGSAALQLSRARLSQLGGGAENSLDWAQYLLLESICQTGLYRVKQALERYLAARNETVSKREAERIRCKKPVPVRIRCKGLVGYAKLLEYSEGYRGFYITTNLNIDRQEPINITIDNTEYAAKVVHQNCFIAKERIFSGYGLSLAS